MNGSKRTAIEEDMVDRIDSALAASRAASEQLLTEAEATAGAWATPRAAGKWSPSQVVEHVARSYEGAVLMAAGQPSAEARLRLAAAHDRFASACRDLAARGAPMRTTMFGSVPVEDFVRFPELHTRHHTRQVGSRPLP